MSLPSVAQTPIRPHRDYLWSLHDPVAAQNPAANTTYFVRVDPIVIPIMLAKFRIYVTTANGNVDVGGYWSDGTTLWRIASSGLIASAGSSAIQVLDAVTPAAAPIGVDLFLALFAVDATLGMGGENHTAAVSAVGNELMSKGSESSLAASYALSALTKGAVRKPFITAGPV